MSAWCFASFRGIWREIAEPLLLKIKYLLPLALETVIRAYEQDAGAEDDSAQSAEGGPADDEQDDQNAEPHVEEMD